MEINQTKFELIDLSHTLDEEIPVWPGSTRFQREVKANYEQGYQLSDFTQTQSLGTHLDSPAHFFPDGRSVDEIPLTELFTPVAVLDVRQKVQADPDYAVLPDDLLKWENQFGDLPSGVVVLALTGWSSRWHDEALYRNADDASVMHFPGFSKELAEQLVGKSVVGIGIDTFSIDCGYSEDFPAHKIILGSGKYQLENLTNIDLLPQHGAYLIVLPVKIKGASEASARVITLVPNTKRSL